MCPAELWEYLFRFEAFLGQGSETGTSEPSSFTAPPLTSLASCVPPSLVSPTDRKPPTPSVLTTGREQSISAPSSCSYLESTTSSHVKTTRSISLGDSEGPVTAELPRALHKPLSPDQELQAIPTTVALTSSIKDHEPALPSWGNHEARASLKLTLSSVCEQLLSPPPREPPTTHVWSQEPVDVPPSMAVTVASFCAPSPVDMSTLGLHSSMFLPKTSASGPLTPPAHLNSLQLLETRSRMPGSTAALLELSPGEYCPWGVARTLAHPQGCLTYLHKWIHSLATGLCQVHSCIYPFPHLHSQ